MFKVIYLFQQFLKVRLFEDVENSYKEERSCRNIFVSSKEVVFGVWSNFDLKSIAGGGAL